MALNVQEIANMIFERWGHQGHVEVDSREELGRLLAISIGLSCIFNGDRNSERGWMQGPHHALKSRPITVVLAGRSNEVLDLVNHARHL